MLTLRHLAPCIICSVLPAQLPFKLPTKLPSAVLAEITPEQQVRMQEILTKAGTGDPECLFFLGNYMFDGRYGFIVDKPLAISCWKVSAAKGHAGSAYNLAKALFQGIAIKQDLSTAIAYLNQAAEAGHTKAIVRLAKAFEDGEGVKKDLKIAESLYLRAAQQRDSVASAALERLKKARAAGTSK
jgi:TPR repeat protein